MTDDLTVVRLLDVKSTDTGINVSFDEYMPPEYAGGSKFNSYSLVKKKTYRNISGRTRDLNLREVAEDRPAGPSGIAEAVAYVGSRSEGFVYGFHKIKCATAGILDMGALAEGREEVTEGEPIVTADQLFRAIDRLLDDEVANIIHAHVETTYSEAPEPEEKASQPRNRELQFTSNHSKAVCRASFAMKIVIPLIMDFCDLRYGLVRSADPRAENPTNSFLFGCMTRILRRFTPQGMDLENKLFKLAESRVVSTQYSDKIMWTYLRNVGQSTDVMIRTLYRKIVVDILPKLEHDRPVVSFIHATLKNQIKYHFQQNFPVQYRPINTIDVDAEDGSNPFERMEQAYQHDEGLGIINAANVDSVIRKYQKELNYHPDAEEVFWYSSAICVNDLQRRLLGLVFQRELGKKEVINYANRGQYVRLLLLADKHLRMHGLSVIADYLMGVPVEGDIMLKETLSGKKFMLELTQSQSYRRLHQRFAHVGQKLADSGLVIKMIATCDKNKFRYISRPNDTEQQNEITHPVSAIADQVLRFISLIC